MPIFHDRKLIFIHIPKTGGTSIEKFLIDKGVQIDLFTETGEGMINGHTPQHLTLREMMDGNLISPNYKIFSIVRDPISRVMSEYFYLKQNSKDLSAHFDSFDNFLDLFLNPTKSIFFDHHNLSCTDFLINHEGQIDKRIEVISFFDVDKIEKIVGEKWDPGYHFFRGNKDGFVIEEKQRARIIDYYQEDYLNFHFSRVDYANT